MKEKLFDYLVSELYPVPECDNCEYNFTRLSSGKCLKCDGFTHYTLAVGIQSDIMKMVKGITKIVKENGNGKTEESKT